MDAHDVGCMRRCGLLHENINMQHHLGKTFKDAQRLSFKFAQNQGTLDENCIVAGLGWHVQWSLPPTGHQNPSLAGRLWGWPVGRRT